MHIFAIILGVLYCLAGILGMVRIPRLMPVLYQPLERSVFLISPVLTLVCGVILLISPHISLWAVCLILAFGLVGTLIVLAALAPEDSSGDASSENV